jgi:hypothetical protein
MKISEIIKAAATIGAPFFPALAAAIPVVNAFLPDDKKLPDTATGGDVEGAIRGLPADRQVELLNADIDLEKTKVIENTKVTQALAEVDKAGASTRPAIAMCFTITVCFNALLTVSMWAYAVLAGQNELLTTIIDSWQMILAINAPFLLVIKAYFGMRTDEKNTRQHTANGLASPLKGIASVISAIRK